MNILADATLPGLRQAFPAPFELTIYQHEKEISSLLVDKHFLVCRANLKINQHLLANKSLIAVATASSGSDNLDLNYLERENIQAIDAKGCNAEAVADYVLSSIAYLELEKVLQGKRIGIVGLGHVGMNVYQRLNSAGYILHTYDPPKSLMDKNFLSCEFDELYNCDLICIHPSLSQHGVHKTYQLFNQDVMRQLKPGCILLNASRGGIVDETALINYSDSIIYCTDVYSNEPQISKDIIKQSYLCTPHIAGHSIEAKYRAVELISQKIHQLMNLDYPTFSIPVKAPDLSQISKSWQEFALGIYNPIIETSQLKQANDLEARFLSLRKEHNFRHNFSAYS